MMETVRKQKLKFIELFWITKTCVFPHHKTSKVSLRYSPMRQLHRTRQSFLAWVMKFALQGAHLNNRLWHRLSRISWKRQEANVSNVIANAQSSLKFQNAPTEMIVAENRLWLQGAKCWTTRTKSWTHPTKHMEKCGSVRLAENLNQVG